MPSARSELPRDAALPGLAWLGARLASGGRGFDVVKHRQGRRLVVREAGAGGARYWKLYRNARAAALPALHGELHALAGAGRVRFRVPGVLGWWPEPCALALAEADGRPLAGLAPSARETASGVAGVALATLHGASCRPARAWTLADEAATLARACATLADHDGTAGVRASRLLEALVHRWNAVPFEPAPIHRDFHPGQVLAPAGADLFVLDWDDAALGAPAIDVGNFAAHLRLEGLRDPGAAPAWDAAERAFLDGYAATRTGVPPDTIAAFTAGTLLRLAALAIERRRDADESARLLDRAERSARA